MIDLKDIINDIQFRNYKLEIIHNKYESLLFVSARFMDRDESKKFYGKEYPTIWQEPNIYPEPPQRRAKIGLPYPIPNHLDSIGTALDFIFYCIKRTEDHEMCEDFYYKGERVFDPHK